MLVEMFSVKTLKLYGVLFLLDLLALVLYAFLTASTSSLKSINTESTPTISINFSYALTVKASSEYSQSHLIFVCNLSQSPVFLPVFMLLHPTDIDLFFCCKFNIHFSPGNRLGSN